MVKREYPRIGETVYEEVLDNGLHVFVFPKPEFEKSYAFFAACYGGMDTRFQWNGRWLDTPMGIAHYLEHKMFDTPDGNALQTLSAAGDELKQTMDGSKPYLVAFHQTVEKFNNGVHDFSEVDYNLRGSVERLDLAVRDLVSVMRQASRTPGKGEDR